MTTTAASTVMREEAGDSPTGWSKAIPLIILTGLIAYCNSFTKAFVFDDYYWIVDNVTINDAASYLQSMGNRYLTALSLLINQRLGGNNVLGYHLFNVAVHIGAALALFGIVRRTLLLSRWGGRYQRSAPWLALAVALFWLVHPLQTQSVTYIAQRCESLMGLFYLLTLYCVLRGAQSSSGLRWAWYGAALVFETLGMVSKEVMATAPVVIFLYDWLFLAGSLRELLRKRGVLYVFLLILPVLLVYQVVTPGAVDPGEQAPQRTAGFDYPLITPLHYAMTQPGVILHYLQLAFWPAPLCFDYEDWPVAQTASEILVPAVVLGVLLVATVWALVRKSWLGFVGAWFFLILAPTSSIVPIAAVAFDYRMYLSLAAVIVLVVAAVHWVLGWLCQRLGEDTWLRPAIAGGLLTLGVAVLCTMTMLRHEDYQNEATLWADTAAKRPNNVRAHVSLGRAYYQAGHREQAIAELHRAQSLNTDDPQALLALGNLYLGHDELDKALIYFTKASKVHHLWGGVDDRIGVVHYLRGQYSEAQKNFQAAVDLHTSVADFRFNLAATLYQLGKRDQAAAAYREALEMDPDFPARVSRQAWQAVLQEENERRDSIKDAVFLAEKACQATGGNQPMMLDILAAAYAADGRFPEAVATAQKALAAAGAANMLPLQRQIGQRLRLYQRGQPFRRGAVAALQN
jgi:tetratricopeptide (TPR) repeat protein